MRFSAVGDMGFQAKCFERIERFRQSGKTILLVTHTMDNILRHCERAMLMEQGTIMMDGTPEEVVATYKTLMTPEAVAAQ